MSCFKDVDINTTDFIIGQYYLIFIIINNILVSNLWMLIVNK